jgi:hypothetical protein
VTVIVRGIVVRHMLMVVGAMLSRMIVPVRFGLSRMNVFMSVLMIMLVAVGVRMIVRMNLIAMRVLVGVSVPMLVRMHMRVFMKAFHFLYSFP